MLNFSSSWNILDKGLCFQSLSLAASLVALSNVLELLLRLCSKQHNTGITRENYYCHLLRERFGDYDLSYILRPWRSHYDYTKSISEMTQSRQPQRLLESARCKRRVRSTHTTTCLQSKALFHSDVVRGAMEQQLLERALTTRVSLTRSGRRREMS